MGLGLKAVLKSLAPSYIKQPADAREALEAISEYCQNRFAVEGDQWGPISRILYEAVQEAQRAVKS